MAILKRDQVRLEDAPASPARPGSACKPQRTSGVRLVRAGGIVRGIELTCACGEVTVIELEYTPGNPMPADKET